MKQCPTCRRTYTDETLNFCLDDGEWLLGGAADEPETAVLSLDELPSESPTRQYSDSRDILYQGKAARTGGFPAPSFLANRRFWVPLAVIAVLIPSAYFAYKYFVSEPGSQIESMAVMPFVNESGNTDLEYLSDGMTETLIASLSQLPNVNVKARSSVFRYKGKDADARTVGNELGVQAILNGRVVQRGQELTIYVELVEAQTENSLWKQSYHKAMANLLTLQNDIARDVAEKLKVKLSGAEEQRLVRYQPENPEAYQLYLKGRFYWNKRTEKDVKKGIDLFRQAVDKDPNYALAHVGIADSLLLLSIPEALTGSLSPEELIPEARAAAVKALEIDDSLAEAYASLAHAKRLDWDFFGAENAFKRSIELNPNYATAHHWYALHLIQQRGRTDEALNEIRRAQELDPLALPINANFGYLLYLAGRNDEAIEQCRKTLDMDPTFALGYYRLGLVYAQKQMYPDAVSAFQKAVTHSDAHPTALSALAHIYAVSGKISEARKILVDLRALSGQRYVSPGSIAMIHLGLGEREQAFQWLELAAKEKNQELTRMNVDPRFDSLRSDPRFQELLTKVGFPER